MAQEPQQYGSYDPRAVRTGRPYDVGYGGYGMMPPAAPGPAPAAPGPLPPVPPEATYAPGRPIPLTQERITLTIYSTLSSAVLPLVGGGFGLVSLYGVVWNLVSNDDGANIVNAIILAIVAIFSIPAAAFMLSIRTVLDATGIHERAIGREQSFPWPASRTGLYVRIALGTGGAKAVTNRAFACVVLPDGRDLELTGLSWTGPWVPALEAKGVAECNRIWQWAVARGYTRETHEYVALAETLGVHQAVRESQERRFGLR